MTKDDPVYSETVKGRISLVFLEGWLMEFSFKEARKGVRFELHACASFTCRILEIFEVYRMPLSFFQVSSFLLCITCVQARVAAPAESGISRLFNSDSYAQLRSAFFDPSKVAQEAEGLALRGSDVVQIFGQLQTSLFENERGKSLKTVYKRLVKIQKQFSISTTAQPPRSHAELPGLHPFFMAVFKEAVKHTIMLAASPELDALLRLVTRWYPDPVSEAAALDALSSYSFSETARGRMNALFVSFKDHTPLSDDLFKAKELVEGVVRYCLSMDSSTRVPTDPGILFAMYGRKRTRKTYESPTRDRWAIYFVGALMNMHRYVSQNDHYLFLQLMRVAPQTSSLPWTMAVWTDMNDMVDDEMQEEMVESFPSMDNFFNLLEVIPEEVMDGNTDIRSVMDSNSLKNILLIAQFFGRGPRSIVSYLRATAPFQRSEEAEFEFFREEFQRYSQLLIALGSGAAAHADELSTFEASFDNVLPPSIVESTIEDLAVMLNPSTLPAPINVLYPYYRNQGNDLQGYFDGLIDMMRGDGVDFSDEDFQGVANMFRVRFPVSRSRPLGKDQAEITEQLNMLFFVERVFSLPTEKLYPLRVLALAYIRQFMKVTQEFVSLILQMGDKDTQTVRGRLEIVMDSFQFLLLSTSALGEVAQLVFQRILGTIPPPQHVVSASGSSSPFSFDAFVSTLVYSLGRGGVDLGRAAREEAEDTDNLFYASAVVTRLVTALMGFEDQLRQFVFTRGLQIRIEAHLFERVRILHLTLVAAIKGGHSSSVDFFRRYRASSNRRETFAEILLDNHPVAATPLPRFRADEDNQVDYTSAFLQDLLLWRLMSCLQTSEETRNDQRCGSFEPSMATTYLDIVRILAMDPISFLWISSDPSLPAVSLGGEELSTLEEALDAADRKAVELGLLEDRGTEGLPLLEARGLDVLEAMSQACWVEHGDSEAGEQDYAEEGETWNLEDLI